jgi:hypothetical protein
MLDRCSIWNILLRFSQPLSSDAYGESDFQCVIASPFSRDSNLALPITASEHTPEELLSSSDAAPADESITLAAGGPLYREKLGGTTDHKMHDIQLSPEGAEKDWKIGDVLEGFRVAKRRQAHLPGALGSQFGPQEATAQHKGVARDFAPGASLVAPGTIKANIESGQVVIMEAPESGEIERLVSVAQMPREEQGFEDGVLTAAAPSEASAVHTARAVSSETEGLLPLSQAKTEEEGAKKGGSERDSGSNGRGVAMEIPEAQARGLVELKEKSDVSIAERTAEEGEELRSNTVQSNDEESGHDDKMEAAETADCESRAGNPVSANETAELELGSGKLPGESFSRTEVGPVGLEKGYLGARAVELEKKRSVPVSLNGTPPRAGPEEVDVAAEGCAAGSAPVGVVALPLPVQLAEFRPSLKPVKTHVGGGSAFSTRPKATKVRTGWVGTFDTGKHLEN